MMYSVIHHVLEELIKKSLIYPVSCTRHFVNYINNPKSIMTIETKFIALLCVPNNFCKMQYYFINRMSYFEVHQSNTDSLLF